MVRLNVGIVAVALSASTVLAYPSTVFSKRQSQIVNIIPAQCVAQCQGISTAFQGDENCASEIPCFCSAQVGDSLSTCLPCVANVDSSLVPDGADATLKQYKDTCAALSGPSSGVVSSTVSDSASAVSVSSTKSAVSAASSAVSSAAAAVSSKASAAGSGSTGKASSGGSTSTSSGSTASQTGAGVASTQKNILAVFAAVLLGTMTAL